MLDILLIYPSIYYDRNKLPKCLDVEHPPLGILYLAAVFLRDGFKVDVIDVGAENLDMPSLLAKIKEKNPKIVGISSMTANIRGAVQTAEAVKKEFPSIKIGLGGPHVSADSDFVKRFSHLFDFGVTGEAEVTLPKIVRKILNGEIVDKINKGEIVENLDTIPEPARKLVVDVPYKKGAMIFSSRGCPYQCIFCSRPAISRMIRYRNPSLIVDEMENIYNETGEDYFLFEDDTLTLNKDHILGICGEITKRGLKFKWTAITRADRVDEEIISAMRKAGCEEITFGVESGSERIRNDIIGKNLRTETIKQAFDLCRKYKIGANAFLMMGFPTETEKDIKDTMNFYKGLNLNIIGIHISLPLPGSRLWFKALEEKKITADVIDKYAKGELGEGFHESWPHYVPDGFTLEDLENYRRRAYYKFYFRPSYILRRFKRDFVSWESLKFDIQTALSLLIRGNTSRQ
ncbi:MAG TPA: radical SAM protein [Candidatus Paceibacterota bacterium]